MSLLDIRYPQAITPIGNPITLTISSNNSGLAGFQYLVLLFVDSVEVARFKATPNVDGWGYFNIRQALREFVWFDKGKIGQPVRYLPSMAKHYQLFMYEMVNGVIDSETEVVSPELVVYCGSKTTMQFPYYDYEEWFAYQSATRTFPLHNDQYLNIKAYVEEGPKFVQNGYLYLATKKDATDTIRQVRYAYFDESMTLLREFDVKTPFGLSLDASDPIEHEFCTMPFLPYSLNELLPSECSDGFSGGDLLFDICKYVQVSFWYNTGSEYPMYSETYEIDKQCPDANDHIEVMFQNQDGMGETFIFGKVKKMEYSNERTFASKPLLNQANGFYNYEVDDYSKFITDVDYKRNVTLISDWLTDAQFEWLAQMVNSPKVYLRETHNGVEKYIPVIVQENSLMVNRRTYDGLKNLTLTFQYTFDESIPL